MAEVVVLAAPAELVDKHGERERPEPMVLAAPVARAEMRAMPAMVEMVAAGDLGLTVVTAATVVTGELLAPVDPAAQPGAKGVPPELRAPTEPMPSVAMVVTAEQVGTRQTRML